MTPVEIGDRSEAMVLARMLQLGYAVLVPHNVSRYDLAYDADGKLVRVQVKTGRPHNGAIVFNPYSIPQNGKRRYYTAEEVDFFGVFVPDTNETFLVPFEDGAGTLRVEAPRNGQTKNIRWAKNYVL